MMRKVSTRWIVSLLIALPMPLPHGGQYVPVVRMFWALIQDDVGHGPRYYWTVVALMILLVYTCAVFLLLSSFIWLFKRMRQRG